MTRRRDYRIELCWLLLLIVIFLLTPSSSTAQSMSWADAAFDCDSTAGWCISIGPIHSPWDLLQF